MKPLTTPLNQKDSPNRNTKNNNESRRRTLDSLDIQIIDELLANADTSSTAIASKHHIPLSTIQLRRAAIESMSVLKHEYTLNPTSFGLRRAEFWVLIEKGKTDKVAQNIFKKYNNVLSVCQQMNSISNIGVVAYVNSSEQLYNMLEEIKSMPFVEDVEYAEIIKVIHTRQVNFLKTDPQNPIH